MYNEFDAGDDYSNEQEMYENDLELRGNNEAWEDAQLEMEQEDEYTEEDALADEYDEDDDFGYGVPWDDEF